MKKKIILSFTVIVVVFAMAILFMIFMQSQPRKVDDDTLIFEGDNQKEIIVDIAIQEDDQVMYIGSVLLKDSKPTLQNVLQAINDSDEGIKINIDNDGNITAVNDTENTDNNKWKIEIDNEEITQNNVNKINVKNNNGITLRY